MEGMSPVNPRQIPASLAQPAMDAGYPVDAKHLLVAEHIASTAVVRPGETLIIGYRITLNRQQADEIKKYAEAALPGAKVFVVDQCSALAVYRPSGAEPWPTA